MPYVPYVPRMHTLLTAHVPYEAGTHPAWRPGRPGNVRTARTSLGRAARTACRVVQHRRRAKQRHLVITPTTGGVQSSVQRFKADAGAWASATPWLPPADAAVTLSLEGVSSLLRCPQKRPAQFHVLPGCLLPAEARAIHEDASATHASRQALMSTPTPTPTHTHTHNPSPNPSRQAQMSTPTPNPNPTPDPSPTHTHNPSPNPSRQAQMAFVLRQRIAEKEEEQVRVRVRVRKRSRLGLGLGLGREAGEPRP